MKPISKSYLTSKEVFQKFVPTEAVSYCDKLYQNLSFEFKIKKARQTKMGDYRFNPLTGKQIITINNDLNPYAFLVTYLHEVAHLLAFNKYGRKIQSHGKEWKQLFKEVSAPMLSANVFPPSVLKALTSYFKNPKASSCSDPVLYQILKQFDDTEGTLFLKDLDIGECFMFNRKTYVKLEKKRTRSVCQEVRTGRKYLISEMAEVSVSERQPPGNKTTD
ncbi:MAG: SprT-like domain-containing protein [Ekhidna sp.]